ncbi:MAG: hypothetical protein AB1813_07935 [Verrucomicrobiota bacterium]
MKTTTFRRALLILLFAAMAAVPVVAQAQKPEKPAGEQEVLPSGREVLARFFKAIGGKEAAARVKSYHAKGQIEMGGIKGTIEIYAAKPNKVLVNTTIPGAGRISSGFNGAIGWTENDLTGPILLEGKALEQVEEQGDLYSFLEDESNFKKVETLGKSDFEGKPCYRVSLVTRSGNELVKYFDVASGLLIGFTGKQDSPFGETEITSVFSDYKMIGDLKVAMKLTQRLGPISMVTILESIEQNQVDLAIFVLPPAIKALAEKEEAPKKD